MTPPDQIGPATIAASVKSIPQPVAAAKSGKSAELAMKLFPPVLVFILAILGWIGLHYGLSEEKAITVPLPWDVIEIGFLDSTNLSFILDGLWISAKAAIVGLAVTIVLGLAFAVAMSQAKWVENALLPYAIAMQTTPILALVPLIGVVIGFDFISRVIVVVLISVFPFINNALFGLLSAEKSQHDLLTLHDASRWTRLVKLQLPAALPAIFTGLRVAAVMAVVGAVVGDFFFTQGDSGLGQLISLDASQLQYERMYAEVILAMFLGIAAYLSVAFFERRAIGKWHTATRAGV
ncbi:MAG: ABC transporter permease subunit [Solirubrobacteraceae bacterium]|nr:ABC transporter permease subunit [Solirubrobacteraceae bacterium]